MSLRLKKYQMVKKLFNDTDKKIIHYYVSRRDRDTSLVVVLCS